ncbi:MAG: hypothetical protein QXE81_01745 [Desulfurococcaceae archaeon]
MENDRAATILFRQEFNVLTTYIFIATSLSLSLMGLHLNEPLLVESGFKVFITLLFLRLVLNNFNKLFPTATITLILLLLFYLSLVRVEIAIIAYLSSCLLVTTLVGKSKEVISVLLPINWFVIATSSIYLSKHEALAKHLAMLTSIVIMTSTFLISRNLLISKDIKIYKKLQNKLTIEKTISKIHVFSLFPDHMYKKIHVRFRNIKSMLQSRITSVSGTHRGVVKALNTALHEKTRLLSNPPRIFNALVLLLKDIALLERHINLLSGYIVSYLIKGSIRITMIERNVASGFDTISSQVEKLQHEVEKALLYILFLMSLLLLTAILFYAIMHS